MTKGCFHLFNLWSPGIGEYKFEVRSFGERPLWLEAVQEIIHGLEFISSSNVENANTTHHAFRLQARRPLLNVVRSFLELEFHRILREIQP